MWQNIYSYFQFCAIFKNKTFVWKWDRNGKILGYFVAFIHTCIHSFALHHHRMTQLYFHLFDFFSTLFTIVLEIWLNRFQIKFLLWLWKELWKDWVKKYIVICIFGICMSLIIVFDWGCKKILSPFFVQYQKEEFDDLH